jgi:hypothetical protein
MDTLNKLLTTLTDLLLFPFRNAPATGLVFWSAVVGVVMAYVFGMTSNQRALRRAADNVRAQLLAIKLFKEDLFVTFMCQLEMLKFTGMRLAHSAPPTLVMIVPLFLLLAQLAMRYEYRPLVKGERTVVTMHVKPGRWNEARDIVLRPGAQFEIETESLRDERKGAIYWRIRVNGNESDLLEWQLESELLTKALPISGAHHALLNAMAIRPGDSFWARTFYPAEPPLPPESPVSSIELQLQPRETLILGWNVPWWATFFFVAMIVALIAGKCLGVQY